jgi:outer membrane protein assembly factor BamB
LSLITGFGFGRLVMLTGDGTPLWDAYIGEYPILLEIDADYSVYASGKNRELFSFDGEGNLRWRYRIPIQGPSGGRRNMSADGKLVVIGNVGGLLYAFDDTGHIVWQQPLGGSTGHNAVDMTPDGQWIVVGTSGGWVALYDRNGTLVWSHKSEESRDPASWFYEFGHQHTGTVTVAMSDDARHIVAGYGDSTIRIFEREP